MHRKSSKSANYFGFLTKVRLRLLPQFFRPLSTIFNCAIFIILETREERGRRKQRVDDFDRSSSLTAEPRSERGRGGHNMERRKHNFLLPCLFFSDLLHPPSFLCIIRYIFTTNQGGRRQHIEDFAFIGSERYRGAFFLYSRDIGSVHTLPPRCPSSSPK